MVDHTVQVLCTCGHFARQVNAKTVYPEQTDAEFRNVWHCAGCNAWAEMDLDTTKPLEGLANRSLHQGRERVITRLLESGMTPEEFRAEMDMCRWDRGIKWFTAMQVEAALTVLRDFRAEDIDNILK